mmetsp:Transcript_46536/g.122906  ORF Transcript_46536/g.122906 Transcript_46536/m.122906 type:complete len:395 (-) Transcript_46536:48-1232(-)
MKLLVVGVLAAHAAVRGAKKKDIDFGADFQVPLMTVKGTYPFYHSTDEIHNELTRLSSTCSSIMSMDTVEKSDPAGGSVSIDYVSVKKKDSSPKNKMFMLFGEHARELISPESALHFLQTLCGETSVKPGNVLDNTEFQIVLNGNPNSRKKVEGGDYCLRVNQNGVDLNRNWDEKWDGSSAFGGPDTNPGSAPFSESETQIFRDLVTDYGPSTFLTVHSGTMGMYMPWAYDMEHLATRNNKNMRELLVNLDKQYCQCPYGAAGKEVGYSCPGTCLDYVYDKLNCSYSFAFEIYTGHMYRDDLKSRWEEKMADEKTALLQSNATLAHAGYGDLFRKHPSDFIQVSEEQSENLRHARNAMECFSQFNPVDQMDFQQTVENWSNAYLDMANEIAAKM